MMHRLHYILRVMLRVWYAPAVGLLLGLLYGAFMYQIDVEDIQTPHFLLWLDNVMTFCLPMALGAGAGLAFNHMRRQARLNRQLSTDNAKLQYQFLTSTLSSHILHEIRNPLHNLMAVIESWRQRLPPDELAIIQRNAVRLQAVTDQISRWHAVDEEIQLREAVPLVPWVEEFVTDKVLTESHQLGIQLEQRIEPVIVAMHPLLLEQCFVSLFHNALEALRDGEGRRLIRWSADVSRRQPGYVEVRLGNTGAPYPAAVVAAQGARPVESRHGGLGLGLVLVRRRLEQVDGSLALTNEQGMAVATLSIPGHRA